ncbi:MAG TPA: peptidase M61 [Acetobacteraceae bacterium]|nr:peptidase M61 [Acetobacteraceae bacterium]
MTGCLRLLPIVALAATPALAAGPEPAPLPPPIVAPADKPYPGEITLSVDATDLDHHVFRMHETIPVSGAGPVTLLYPKWIPGDHGPTGPLPTLAGLVVRAGGQVLAWQRDVVNMYAFHVVVPSGASSIDIVFQYLSPPTEDEGRVVMTPNMLDVQWNPEILYPAGTYARDINVHPSLVLPDGWQYGSALEAEHQAGSHITFKPVSLNVLLDSPLYAGRYFSRIDLAPGSNAPVHLDVVADRPEDLEIKPKDLEAHRNLVVQATRNFGSHHYNHYDFLLSLSDEMGGEGLEHHRSSEDGTGREYFTDLEKSASDRDLLPHEYTHSWNGKFRRPADLYSPDFTIIPERDSLLWVYEGQTEYWGQVLAARSGILSAAQIRDSLALFAADEQMVVGRSWRNLQDTTNDPILNMRRPLAWRSYQREEDYYTEGALIWLDADTLIREKSNGARSLTDFAQKFFGDHDGSWVTETYNFNDVVDALNAVQPYDWAHFLRTRLDGHPNGPPLDGLTRGGYKLVYTDEKSGFQKSEEGRRKGADFTYSIGLSVGEENAINSVQWGGPAFRAGLARGPKIIAVNGLALDDADDLATAITAAKTSAAPIELLVQDGKHFRTVKIDYHGGLRYPHLERIPGTPDRLDDILAPLK